MCLILDIIEAVDKQVETGAKIPEPPRKTGDKMPKMTRGEFLRWAVTGAGAAFLTACGVKVEGTPTTPFNPTETPTSVPSETSTPTASATVTEAKTATPTEKPLFTEEEVKAGSSFDLSNWPERFKKPMEHPETATEQEWQDSFQYLLAVREKDEIPKTAEYKDHINTTLQSLWNGAKWMQEHPDEVKEKHLKLIISPVEYRAMIQGSNKSEEADSLPPKDLQGWNSEYIGPILGQSIDAERHPFDKVSGKLAGFGTIGGQDVILIDMRDKDGYHVLFPVVVYIGNGPTLPKGSKCLVEDMNYSNKHNGSPLFVLPKDEELSPLVENVTGKVVSWEDLCAGLGKMIVLQGGGYMGELQNKTGVSSVYGFSPGLNLEMGYIITISDVQGSSSPWTEKGNPSSQTKG